MVLTCGGAAGATELVPGEEQRNEGCAYVLVRDDVRNVLQQKLSASLPFLQLLEQQAGLQVPGRHHRRKRFTATTTLLSKTTPREFRTRGVHTAGIKGHIYCMLYTLKNSTCALCSILS